MHVLITLMYADANGLGSVLKVEPLLEGRHSCFILLTLCDIGVSGPTLQKLISVLI